MTINQITPKIYSQLILEMNDSPDHKLNDHTLDQLLGTPEFSQKVIKQPRFLFDMIESLLNELRLVHAAGRTQGKLRLADIVLLVKNGQPVCQLRDMPLETGPDTHQLWAPERSEYCHSGVDVFEFGFLLYQLLHNQPIELLLNQPSIKDTPLTTAEFSQEVALGFRPAIHHQIPKMWSDTIKACWAQDPLDRPTAESLWRKFKEWENAADTFMWSLLFYDTHIVVNVADPHSQRMFRFPKMPRSFTIEEAKNHIARQNFRHPKVQSLFIQHQHQELQNDELLPHNDDNQLNMVLMTEYCRVQMDLSLPLCRALTNVPMDNINPDNDNMVCNIPWSNKLTVCELKEEIAKLCAFKAGMGCCLFRNGVELKDDENLTVGLLPGTSIDCVFTLGEVPLNDLRLRLATETENGAHANLLLSLKKDCSRIVKGVGEQVKNLITGTPYEDTSIKEVTDEAVIAFLNSSEKDHTHKQILTFCQSLVQCMEHVLQREDMHSGKDSHIFAWEADKMLERFGFLLINLGLLDPNPEKAKVKLLEMRAKFIWMATCSFKKFAIDAKYASGLVPVTKNEKELTGLKHTRLCSYIKLNGKYAEKYDVKAEADMDEETKKRYEKVLECSENIEKIKLNLTPLRKKLEDIDRIRSLLDKIVSLKAKIEALKKRHERQSENLQSYGAPIGSELRKEQEEQIQALSDQFEKKEVRLREVEEELERLEATEKGEMDKRRGEFIAKNRLPSNNTNR